MAAANVDVSRGVTPVEYDDGIDCYAAVHDVGYVDDVAAAAGVVDDDDSVDCDFDYDDGFDVDHAEDVAVAGCCCG